MNFTVLVIEDDAALRASIVRLIRRKFPGRNDLTIRDAESYDKAVDQHQQAEASGHPVQFVVSDFQYPGSNDQGSPNLKGDGGIDFYTFCQEHNRDAGFVFHSGADVSTINAKIAERGLPTLAADHILSKPMQTQDVIPHIQKRLDMWDARDAQPRSPVMPGQPAVAAAALNAQ